LPRAARGESLRWRHRWQWFFSGGLSDVEYWIDVTDTETDETRNYHNPPGEICGQADVRSFFGGEESSAVALTAPLRWSPPAAGKAGGCLADEETLCLLDGRFEVRVEWRSATAEACPSVPG